MDHEYLQNIAGSPYTKGIEERLGTRVKTGLKNFGAMVGSGALESKEYTYVKSAYSKFESDMKHLLQEFAQNADRLKYSKPSPNEQQRELIDGLIDLENMFNPTTFQAHQYNKMQPSGTPPNHSKGMYMGPSSAKPDPKKHWDAEKKAQLNKFDASIEESSKLQDLTKESIFDRYNTDIDKAWYSRDINKILKSYIDVVRSIVNAFYAEVKKYTGLDQAGAKKIIKDVNKSGVGILDKAEQVVKSYDAQFKKGSNLQTPTGATPTGADIGADPEVHDPSGTPPVIPPESKPEAKPYDGAKPPVIGADGKPAFSTGGTIKLNKNDYAAIVLKTMNIIIDAVESDVAHSEPFVGPKQKELPKAWGDPDPTTEMKLSSLLKEISEADDEVETPETPEEPSPETPSDDGNEEVEQIPGEFLYNFASKNRKYPSQFHIDVPPGNKENNEIEIPVGSGNKMTIEVIWHVDKQKNDIYANLKDNETGAKGLYLIFRFFTHQVNPKAESGKSFNINQALQQAHSLTMQGNPLEGADPKIVQQIMEKANGGINSPFGRSLYATVQRRSMEFKPKKKSKRRLTFDKKSGAVTDTSSGKPETYTQAEVGAMLNSDPENANAWTQDLQNIGYFDVFPTMKPKAKEEHDVFKQAVSVLQNKPYSMSPSKALQAAQNAWDKIRMEYKKAPSDIELMDILKLAAYSDVVAKADSAGKAGSTPPKPEPPKPTATGEWPQGVDPANVGVINPVMKFDKTNGNVYIKQKDGSVKSYTGFPAWDTLDKEFQDELKKSGYPLDKVKGYSEKPAETPTTKPEEKPAEPAKSKEEQAFENINKALEAAGIGKLVSLKAAYKLNSLKGNWNAQIKKKAKDNDDESILDLMVGKTPPEGSKRAWAKLVAAANEKAQAVDKPKETPKETPKEEPPKTEPTNERVNPFQRDNFLI